MKRIGVLLAAFALLAAGVVSRPDEEDDSKPDTSCQAFASLSIEIIGPGHCEGRAMANCTVLEASRDVKDEIMEDWFSAGVCDEAAQRRAASALADSVGTVWGGAIATVNCTGRGYGCGWAFADPASWGASLAQMFVESAEKVIKTGEYEGLDDFCPVDLLGSEDRLGADAKVAMDKVCRTRYGNIERFHQEYVDTTKDDILAAIKIAASGACGEMSMESECNPEKKPVVPVIPICGAATQRRCCNARMIRHKWCLCTRCHNPLRLASKDPVIWRDGHGHKCECPEKSSVVLAS